MSTTVGKTGRIVVLIRQVVPKKGWLRMFLTSPNGNSQVPSCSNSPRVLEALFCGSRRVRARKALSCRTLSQRSAWRVLKLNRFASVIMYGFPGGMLFQLTPRLVQPHNLVRPALPVLIFSWLFAHATVCLGVPVSCPSTEPGTDAPIVAPSVE